MWAWPSTTGEETAFADDASFRNAFVQPARVELTAAINEVVSFRFSIQPVATPVEDPRIRVSPLRSDRASIEADQLKIFRLHRVRISKYPGWHIRSIPPSRRREAPWDVLVPIHAPRGGLSDLLEPGTSYPFWVDVRIPKGTSEGVYHGRIALRTRDRTIASLEIRLQVLPIVLPDEGDVDVIATLDHVKLLAQRLRVHGTTGPAVNDWLRAPEGRQMNALLTSTMRQLRRHRLTPVLDRLLPVVKVDRRESVVIDWSAYDTIAGPFLSGRAFFDRIPLRHWPIPTVRGFMNRDDDETDRGKTAFAPRSSSLKNLTVQFLTQCAMHFDRKGWLDRSYVPVVIGDDPLEKTIPRIAQFAQLVREADPRMRVLTDYWPQNMTPYGWVDYPGHDLSALVDLWSPRAQFFQPAAMARQRRAGHETWLTVDRPPYSGSVSIVASPSDQRVLCWQAARVGAPVLRLGTVNNWPESQKPPAPTACIRFDPNCLLYPGGAFGLDEPVASVRLKLLRQSLQDSAYRKLLVERGLGHVKEMLVQSLAPYLGTDAYRTHFADGRSPGWATNPRAYELARSIMIDALLGASRGRRSDADPAVIRRTADWRRFLLTTRAVRMIGDGVRVRAGGVREGRATTVLSPASVVIEASITLENRTRLPIEGRMELGPLPEGWTRDSDTATVTLSPGQSRRVVLQARATQMPTTTGGHLALPVLWRTPEDQVRRHALSVSFLTAVRYAGRLTLDGDLSDWPAGLGNVAADFQSIARDEAGEGPAGARATTRRRPRTLVFVMRDGAYLYVAINAETEADNTTSLTSSNVIRYDDLIPRSGELVELLFDPLNAGTRSPSDLYHIVIKPSGSYLAEKGIRTDPPCGRRSLWPVDLTVATREHAGRWTAEVRIPLSAFGNLPQGSVVWGFNVTRFEAPSHRFTTWSGAVGNAYDPLSLGNLYLP